MGRLRHASSLSLFAVLGLFITAGGLADASAVTIGVGIGWIALALGVASIHVLPTLRRVLRAGYGWEDTVSAVITDVNRRREELDFQIGRGAGFTERTARRSAYAGLGVVGLGAALGVTGILDPMLAVGTVTFGSIATVVAGTVATYGHRRRHDTAGEGLLRFWRSRLGEWTTRLAGLGLRRLPADSTSAARRAEAAIATSALGLFRELPEHARDSLEELPEVVARLQAWVGTMRAWMAAMEESEARDVAPEHAGRLLADSVTALEAIRLRLYRLNEGIGSIAGVTAELDAAQRVGEKVERWLARRPG